MSGDLIGGTVGDWLVVAWFTPDYRPLAEAFAANLTEHGAPFHLWAKPKSERGWNTHQKPSVVLQAMDAYPGKTLILMDADCTVRGDIAPVVDIAGDVGINIKARQVRRFRALQKRITVTASSRVVVFRPTDGARAFAREWERMCSRAHYGGDETAMAWAYLLRPEVSYAHIDPRCMGREVTGDVADALIVHESAYNKKATWSPKKGLKALERRYLRTGWTKAQMVARIG